MRKLLFLMISVIGMSLGQAGADDACRITKFHNAVQAGDVNTVKTMLASNSSLTTSLYEHKFQPIHLLDTACNEGILDVLLANGADINARNDEGITLLHIVTDPGAVDLIMKRGANIEARDIRGRTPLIEQANNQDNGPDVVAALLAHGANPNAKSYKRETALSFARETGDEEFITVLISAGAKD